MGITHRRLPAFRPLLPIQALAPASQALDPNFELLRMAAVSIRHAIKGAPRLKVLQLDLEINHLMNQCFLLTYHVFTCFLLTGSTNLIDPYIYQIDRLRVPPGGTLKLTT